MTRLGWCITALLLGLAAFGTVLWWPVRPMWVHGRNAHTHWLQILGFPQGRATVLVAEHLNSSRHLAREVTIFEKDLESGAERSRWLLPSEEDGLAIVALRACSDARKLFVIWAKIDGLFPDRVFTRGQRVQMLDAKTGVSLHRPFDVSIDPGSLLFSRNGQWCCTTSSNTPETNNSANYDVISTDTGRILFSFTENSDRQTLDQCLFSPDSSEIAIHWYYKKDSRHTFAVHELSTGKKRGEYELPSNILWPTQLRWEPGRMFLDSYGNLAGTQLRQYLTYSYEMTPNGLGPGRREPIFDSYQNQFGHVKTVKNGNRIVQITQGSPDSSKWRWWQDLLAWADRKWCTEWSKPDSTTSFRFLDAQTGITLSNFTLSHQQTSDYHLSSDGHYLASLHPRIGLMMWNADPSPRWPYALITSFLTLFSVLFLGRILSRRSLKKLQALSAVN